MSCGCQSGHDCGCHAPALYGWHLGAMDPATAAAQIIGSDSHVNASSRAAIQASAQAGQMLNANGQPAYIPGTGDCSAVNGSGMLKPALTSTAGGLALKFAGAAGPAAPAVMAIGGILEVFGAIFAHHAAAVKKEQGTLCAAVPAANQALQVIDEAVASGATTPQQAISALQSLPGQFQSEVSGIYNDCNAACVMTKELQAICAVKVSQYQDLIAGAAQVVTAGGPNVSQPAGVIAPASSYAGFYSPSSTPPSAPNTVAAPTTTMPSFALPKPASAASGASGDWLPIAALVIGGFFLLRSL
jgi:hypothetical protein